MNELYNSARTDEPPATTDNLLEVEGLEVQFAGEQGWVTVVQDVSFSLARGETLGIVGESGSGKTVTGLALLGLIPGPQGRITAGSIRFKGRELVGAPRRQLDAIRGEEISMVFQEPMTSLNPAFKVGDQISEVYRRHRRVGRREARARAVEMLDRVGIPNAAQRARGYPHEFSGGMRQRAMIALALVCDPEIVVADEPTTALDVTIQAQILELLAEMRREFEMSLLFVTHDLGVVADICDRVLVMYAGQVVESATIEDLYYHPAHPYSEALLAAMPQVGGLRAGRLPTIPGNIPAPGEAPSGCRFHPRCAYVLDRCREPEAEATADRSIGLRDLGGRASRCVRVDELDLRGSR